MTFELQGDYICTYVTTQSVVDSMWLGNNPTGGRRHGARLALHFISTRLLTNSTIS